MRLLIAPTEDFIKTERTLLNEKAEPGSNIELTVKSNVGIKTGNFIAIGYEGSDRAELQKVTAKSGSTKITVETLKFNHAKGEHVAVFRFDKRKFYGSKEREGSYSELVADGSPKGIMVDDTQGTRLEYTGDEGYKWFKATYYNSETEEESSIADADPVEADEAKRYCSLYAIAQQAGLVNNPFISDGLLETFRKRAENEINSKLYSRYRLPLSEVPSIIENICTLLAAGYIDYQEFGAEGEGKKWLGEARGLLKAIQGGRQRLLDYEGNELPSRESGNVLSGHPDAETEGPMFKRGQKF